MKRSKIITSCYEQEEDGHFWQEPYGFSVLDSHPFAKWIDGELYLGYLQVQTCDWEKEFLQGAIPVWLVCRDYRGGFICGFDLLENGNVWAGHNRQEYSDLYEAFCSIMEYNKKNGEFYSFTLSLEEPMALSND